MTKSAAVLFVVLTTTVVAQTPPPAAPSKPATYVSGADIAAVLQKAGAGGSGMNASNVTNSDHYRINVIRRTQAAGAIVHRPGTELHYILEGAGTLVTGGSVVRPAAGAGGTSTIEGGVTRRVVKGDAILVPEGTPHQYTAVEGSIVYLEVRFNVPVE